ncbi:MAG: TRAP transporter substrate-binding protein [Candidatus Rokuibacteriota bacterium]
MVRVALALLLVAWLGCPEPAPAQQLIRIGHSGQPGSLLDLVAAEYARRVNDQLKGKVEVRVFPASELGTDEQMINGVKLGVPEIFISSAVMSTVEPKLAVFELPYLIVSRSHLRRVSESAEVRRMLVGALPAQGMRVLAFWESGFRHVTNNVRAVVRPEDLQGVRLRVPGGVWRTKMFSRYGATPSALPFAELHAALRSGAIDGQENPLAEIHAARLHEVQRHLSLTGHVYSPAYVVVGETFWQKLPAEHREVLERLAVELGDVARTAGTRLEGELLAKMTADGKMKANEVDKEAFIRASAPIHAEFVREVPEAALVLKLIESLR